MGTCIHRQRHPLECGIGSSFLNGDHDPDLLGSISQRFLLVVIFVILGVEVYC